MQLLYRPSDLPPGTCPCEDAFTENADRVADDCYGNLTGREQTAEVNDL